MTEESTSPTSHLARKLTFRQTSTNGSSNVEQHYPVTLAIDFGTTFSGCSYKCVDDEEVHDVTKWPKHTGFYAKVPTLLYYRKRTKRLVDWGDGARRLSLQPGQDGVLIQQFKLWLAEEEEDNDGQRSLLLPGQTVIDVIADYLQRFHEVVVQEVQKTIGTKYSVDQYRYCLTVPAIWTDRAKAAMREAMVQAGILSIDDPPSRLLLVSEPEAAAIYCGRHCWDMDRLDKFMIVDAGGGTVDLIVYQVDRSSSERKLKEITRGSGGMCGSAYIDNNLRELLIQKMGEHAGKISPCTMENVMQEFTEQIKPVFCGDRDQLLQVPAIMRQDDLFDSLIDEDGFIHLSATELNDQVYRPVFERVISLIEDQLQRGGPIDAMFLVGGFGCSEYLYHVLKSHFEPRVVPSIVMAPRGDVAIARGAVYVACGGDPKVSSRIVRRTYGLRTRMVFQEGLDSESSAVVTDDGVKRCSTRFDVMVSKGERVDVDTRSSRRFWVRYPKNTEADLYAYDGDGPIPRHVTDPGVKKIVDFPIKMPALEGYHEGDLVDIRIDFIFGLTELKVQVFIADHQIELSTAFE